MSKEKRKPPQHISVTIDFLRTVPGFDVQKDNDLRAALYALGFQVTDKDGNPKHVTVFKNKNVRCANMPSTYRKTMIFVGEMRPDYKYAKIYNGVEILDVGVYSGSDMEFVLDLPYDIPVIEKVNTRKYTKRGDRPETFEITFDIEDEARLGDVFGLEDE
jgi:hypothetical protein